MLNIVFALGFMAVSIVIAVYLATQSEKSKPFIYAVGLASMLGQILLLFIVLHLFDLPLGADAQSFGTACGSIESSTPVSPAAICAS